MLKTLIFREYRYNTDIEGQIKICLDKLEQNPNDVETLQELAGIYHAYKKNDEAIEIYEKLTELAPNNHEILAFLGYLHYENDNLYLAECCFRKSLEITQKEPFVIFLLGNILSRTGKIMEAINCYEKAIFLDFDITTAHIDFGRKYEHMGRHKKAYNEYMAAYNLDPSDSDLKEKIEYIRTKF